MFGVDRLQGSRREDAKLLPAQLCFRDRLGIEGAHLAVDLECLAIPVDARFGLLDPWRVAGALLRLGYCTEDAGTESGKRLDQQLGSERRQLRTQGAAGMRSGDLNRPLQEHGTGVEAFIELHDRHAGARIAGEYGALDRSRAAPARQKRSVNIDAAECRERENLRRHDEPVRHHDEYIRPPAGELRTRHLAFECLRLEKRKVARDGRFLHRTCREAAAASARPIGLRQDPDNLVLTAKSIQSRQRKLRRPSEGDSQLQ